MEMYKLKFTRLQNEIFRMLCMNSGKEFNKREISKLLSVSPTAVAKSLILLKKEGLVKIQREGKINLDKVFFNRDFQKAINLKRVENLKGLYESGMVDFLSNNFPGATIILFGSYSLGEDVFDSDIDFAIIGSKEKELDLKRFEKYFKKEIRINFYENFKIIHKNLKENLLRGIVLFGGIVL